MKDTVSESEKILVTVSDSFKNFDLVVTTFGEAVGDRRRERVEYTGDPIDHGLSTFFESFNTAVKGRIDPIG